jgi:hypothetical protein
MLRPRNAAVKILQVEEVEQVVKFTRPATAFEVVV